MDFLDLCSHARSVRRFREALGLDPMTALDIVEAARLAPCAANLQELRFMVILEETRKKKIFPILSWAGYLEDWPGPSEGERPAGYIVILAPEKEKPFTRIDAGIAAGYMSLASSCSNLGACILMSFDRNRMGEALDAPAGFLPLLVVALGEPAEEIVLETVGEDGPVEYWRDREGVHHVPKRSIGDLIVT